MIEIKENDRIYGMWMVDLQSPEIDGEQEFIGNWLGVLKGTSHEDMRFFYRFRWFRDDKIFESDDERAFDERAFYEVEFQPSTPITEALAAVDQIYRHMSEVPPELGTGIQRLSRHTPEGIGPGEFLKLLVDAGLGQARPVPPAKAQA